MKSILRIIAILLMLACLLVLVPSGAIVAQAEIIQYSLEEKKGVAPQKDGFTEEWAYEDPSISVSVEYLTICPAYKAKSIPCSIVRIRVADPSQVRTTMSYEDYDKQKFVKAETMAQHVNAIAAVNGDFFKYHYKVGYVLRQGEFFRDKLNGKFREFFGGNLTRREG